MLVFTGLVQAQDISVSGTVTSRADGETLPGVTVTNTASGQSTATDANGKFTIRANAGAVLRFSFVGFVTKEQAARTATLNILLDSKSNDLNEVVVVGYGTALRKDLVNSVSKIDPKDVPQAANSSVAQLVFGRTPGVAAVQRSAEPGGNIQLSIRGKGDPIVIIDGVQMSSTALEPGNSGVANELNGVRRGGFAGLNPDDIESMEFLKDASAAIYGVNAGNGVVLITTKKGRAGRTSVSYDGSRSYSVNNKYLEPLTANAYMEYFNQLKRDQYLFNNNMAPYGNVAPGTFNAPFTADQVANAGEGTDWLDLTLRDGSIDNHNVTISGGSEKLTYYFSGGYFDQNGTVRNSGMKRYTGRTNLNFFLTKWLSLNGNISGSRANYANSTAGWQTGSGGNQSFGSLQAAIAYPRSMPVYDDAGRYSLFQVTGNPVSLLDIKDNTVFNSLNTIVSLDFKIIGDDLRAKLLYGNNNESSNRDFFVPSTTFYYQMYRSRGSRNQADRVNQTMEAQLTYKKNLFDNKLNVDLLGVVGQYQLDASNFGAASADMQDGINTNDLRSGTGAIAVESSRRYEKKRSYLGRANFQLLDKYILQVTGRYDGYSQFFPENKYAFFPSVTAGWKISNEPFLKDVKFLDMLKLRGSMGITGDATNAFAYASYSPDNTLISFNSGTTQIIPYTLSQLDQPNLTWPKLKQKNLGLDFSFFNSRIAGAVELFREDETRIINTSAPTAPLSFFGTQPVNGAHRVRKGWEGSISTVNVRSENFKWNSSFNITHMRYDWKERFEFDVLNPGVNATDPINSIYVFKTDGLIQIGETLSAAQQALPARGRLPGNPRILDLNGDGKLDAEDIVRYDSAPNLTIGFGNTFSYKNFDFNVSFYGRTGGYGFNVLRNWANAANFVSGNQSGISETMDIWSTTNPQGTIPGVAFDQGALGLPAGLDVDIQKTDFIRCRNIGLGYTVNDSFLTRHLSNLRLFVDVQNPFIITNYKIADPEVQVGNVKGGAAPYPVATTYSLGIKAGF